MEIKVRIERITLAPERTAFDIGGRTQFLDTKVVENKYGEDPVFQRLCAMEKVTQRAMSRFPLQKVYVLLKKVMNARIIVGLHAGEEDGIQVEDMKLKSTDQLSDMLSYIQRENGEEIPEQDINSMKAGLGFFLNSLSYLKDLKEYFDENIHACLKETYFVKSKHKPIDKEQLIQSLNLEKQAKGKKPAPSIKGNAARFSTKKTPRRNPRLRESNGHLQPKDKAPVSEVLDPVVNGKSGVTIVIDETPEGHRLAWFADELDGISEKWRRLLQSGDLNIDDFDPDSHHELIQFVNYTAFETLLRLVPDIFVKSYKAVEIGKVWLRQAYKVYNMTVPQQADREPTIEQQLKQFTEKLKQSSSLSHSQSGSGGRTRTLTSSRGRSPRKENESFVIHPANEQANSDAASSNNSEKSNTLDDKFSEQEITKVSTSSIDFLNELCDSDSEDNQNPGSLKYEFKRVYNQIKCLLAELDEAIADDEQQLKQYSYDMKTFHHNDAKFDRLKQNYEQAIRDREIAINEYKEVVNRSNSAKETLSRLSGAGLDFNEQKKLVSQTNEEELTKRNREELLGFKLKLLEEDYMLELEIRPNHIRRMGAMQQKIADLSNKLSGKRSEQKSAIQSLKSLQSMKSKEEIMERFLEIAENIISRLKLELRIKNSYLPISEAEDTNLSDNSACTLTSRSVRFSDELQTIISRNVSRASSRPTPIGNTQYSLHNGRVEA